MTYYAREEDRVPADRERVAGAGHGIFTVECCGEPVDGRHGDVVDVAFGASYPSGELIEFGVHVTIRNTGLRPVWLVARHVRAECTAPPGSFYLRTRFLYGFGPLRALRLYERGELARRVAHDIHTLSRESLAKLRLFQRADDFGVQTRDDRLRRLSGGENPEPRAYVESRQA